MKLCPGCGRFEPPDWDHDDDCPNWPGSEGSRRYGWMENCGGLADCDTIHPYKPHDECECEGMCHICSHIGCERCVDRAYADRPWWRKLLGLEPGRWRRGLRLSLIPRSK